MLFENSEMKYEKQIKIADIGSLVRCFNQVFHLEATFVDKYSGDCSICTYDLINNKKCLKYYPITIHYFEAYVGELFKQNQARG